MYVYVVVVKDAHVYSQQVGMSLDVLQSQHGALLHHVSQIAGERELASLALAQTGLDEQYLTAHAGPCQSSHHACIAVALVFVAVEGRVAQQLLHAGRCDGLGQLVVSAACHIERHLSEQFAYLLLQSSHTALARVPFYNELQSLLAHLG